VSDVSINLLKGFEYRNLNTFLHRLDPRTKLTVTLVYSVLALMFTSLVPLALFTATLIPFLISGRIVRRWMTSMKGLWFIIFFILVLNTWLRTLDFALSMCLRIVLLVTAFTLFFMSVHPDDLSLSLLAMHVPYSFTFTLSLATRFMPALALEAQNIIDAQRSRGLELEKGNLITRVKNMVPIIVPLIINSIKRAYSVAEALESKAFGAVTNRTNYFQIKMKKRDYAIIGIVLAFAIIYSVLSFTQMLPAIFYFNISSLFPNLLRANA